MKTLENQNGKLMQPLELERQFCLALGAYAAGLKDKDALWSLLSNGRLNADRAIGLARRHGLGPAAFRLVANPEFKNHISPGAYQQLVQDQALSMEKRDVFERSLDALLRKLNCRQLPVIPLKGILYAHKLYDNPWLRSFSDIDLLVREEDWPDLPAIFKDLDYKPRDNYEARPAQLTKNDIPQHMAWRSPSGCVFDIALDLFKLGLRSPLSELIWTSASGYSLDGQEVLVLSNEFEILNICVHLHRHGFNRLIWFVDLALAAQKLAPDWNEVARLARAGGLQASVYFSLNYLNRFFGPVVDASIIDKFYPGRISGFFFTKHWPEADVSEHKGLRDGPIVFRGKLLGANQVANLALSGRAPAKAAYFARKLWPSHEFLKSKFDRESHERTYLSLYFKRCAEYIKSLPKRTPTTSSGQ